MSKQYKFSELEKKIIAEMRYGYTNREIAEKLNFSPYTIKYHVARIIAKTGAVNRINAVFILCRDGYFKPNEQDEKQFQELH